MDSISLFNTQRSDRWWFEPLWTGFGFLCFVIYTTWAMLQGDYYWWSAGVEGFGGYLSPFYSPLIFINPIANGAAPMDHSWFGSWPEWWPNLIPASPAILILAGPLSFRMTCYYYRKFYYRAYFMSPPGCSVKGIRNKKYKGETALLIFQNLHRLTLYIAIGIIFILSYDAILSFFQGGKFGVGVGSIILTINPILLIGYTFGCHALRHLSGGHKDCFTCPNGKLTFRYRVWKGVSWLNGRHMMWAWISMIWVAFTDIYVRMVSSGYWIDMNTWNN
ncbi:MAG: succinate dehydrogenase [Candidatus Neomarinimicrobiota bacterium]|nr:succinate dehydrogenase [Candidatus Neomarinimicrobiota bacterium]